MPARHRTSHSRRPMAASTYSSQPSSPAYEMRWARTGHVRELDRAGGQVREAGIGQVVRRQALEQLAGRRAGDQHGRRAGA